MDIKGPKHTQKGPKQYTIWEPNNILASLDTKGNQKGPKHIQKGKKQYTIWDQTHKREPNNR